MVFKFRSSRYKGDAQRVGEELSKIHATRGHLLPPDIVDTASNPDNILHGYFEWTDTVAAKEYRLHQARMLVASVVAVEAEGHGEIEPLRAFIRVRAPEQDINSYEPVARVMSDARLREKVLFSIMDELARMRKKLAAFEDFADVLAALTKVEKIANRRIQRVRENDTARR